jgi:hypothetical protein
LGYFQWHIKWKSTLTITSQLHWNHTTPHQKKNQPMCSVNNKAVESTLFRSPTAKK